MFVGSNGDVFGPEAGQTPLYPTRIVLLKVAGELKSKVSLSADAIPSFACEGCNHLRIVGRVV